MCYSIRSRRWVRASGSLSPIDRCIYHALYDQSVPTDHGRLTIVVLVLSVYLQPSQALTGSPARRPSRSGAMFVLSAGSMRTALRGCHRIPRRFSRQPRAPCTLFLALVEVPVQRLHEQHPRGLP